jgi:hypothetical protein
MRWIRRSIVSTRPCIAAKVDLQLGYPQAQRSDVAFKGADAGRQFVEAEVDAVESLV